MYLKNRIKERFSLIILSLIIPACSIPDFTDIISIPSDRPDRTQTESIPSANPSADWDKSRLDTARNTNWTNFDKDVVLALNMARTNPTKFANENLEPLLNKFDGNILNSDRGKILTKEGVSAVQEAIRVLKNQTPVSILSPAQGLHLAARDHVQDTGPSGVVSHQGTDGSTPFQRMERYGNWKVTAGENIEYGARSGFESVINLIVDDGVANRGHRKNIYNNDFRVIGVASGDHKTYGSMSVSNFAGGYTDK